MKNTEINIRDPFVLVEDGTYYMYGTRAATCWGAADGFDCYVSKDMEDWDGPFEVFHKPEDFWADRNCWAPEVHKYRGFYYMFATFKDSSVHGGTAILKSESPLGPFVMYSDRQITPKDWECIDGTFYVSPDGTPYMVFVHEWVQISDGSICAVELSRDLKEAGSVPVTLFHASVAYSDNGDITGKWTQDDRLLFLKDGGHGMIFESISGELYLTLHTPNEHLKEHPVFYRLIEEEDTLRVAELS